MSFAVLSSVIHFTNKTFFRKQLFLLMAFAIGISANAKTINPLSAIQVIDAAGHLVNGTFEVKRFIGKQGQVWAIGILTGSVSGKQVTRGVQFPVTLSEGFTPLAIANRSEVAVETPGIEQATAVQCEILNL